jgi:hypothetical protein
MVKLGTRVTDSITGFAGIATCRTEYLYGCVRIGVEPQVLQEGKPGEIHYFDEQRLEEASTAETGGPQPDPPSIRPPG